MIFQNIFDILKEKLRQKVVTLYAQFNILIEKKRIGCIVA